MGLGSVQRVNPCHYFFVISKWVYGATPYARQQGLLLRQKSFFIFYLKNLFYRKTSLLAFISIPICFVFYFIFIFFS